MSNLRSIYQNIGRNLDMGPLIDSIDNLSDKTVALDERIANVNSRLDDIHSRLSDIEDMAIRNKAFVGGVIFAVTAVFSVITALAHYFKLI